MAVPSLVMDGLTQTQPESLQGIWEVTDVHKDGNKESAQVGGIMTFTRDTVTFKPKIKTFMSIS
jgi:hypothetical protein